MMWYVLSVETEKVHFPKTLEMLGFENYYGDDGSIFESEYFCDIEEKADCLVEMGIDFHFVVLPDYGTIARIEYDTKGYLEYKKVYNEEV